LLLFCQITYTASHCKRQYSSKQRSYIIRKQSEPSCPLTVGQNCSLHSVSGTDAFYCTVYIGVYQLSRSSLPQRFTKLCHLMKQYSFFPLTAFEISSSSVCGIFFLILLLLLARNQPTWGCVCVCVCVCVCGLKLSLRTALFWGVTQRRVVILYRRFGTTYQSHLQGSRSQRRKLVLEFLTLENGTDTLSRNVGKGLPLDVALYPRRVQFSSASRRKPEVAKMKLHHDV
jgi:hypothetical protein